MDKKLVKLIKEQEKQNFPQNEINKIDYIIEKAYKKGMCIIFNPSPYNDEIKNIGIRINLLHRVKSVAGGFVVLKIIWV